MSAKAKKSERSVAELWFWNTWLKHCTHLAAPERDYVFHPERAWQMDFAWPAIKLCVELDGRGRHQTVDGVRKDCEKHNEAVRLGWRVLRFPSTDKAEVDQWVEFVVEVMCYG
jgi:very-short-patch-repair endonuclease